MKAQSGIRKWSDSLRTASTPGTPIQAGGLKTMTSKLANSFIVMKGDWCCRIISLSKAPDELKTMRMNRKQRQISPASNHLHLLLISVRAEDRICLKTHIQYLETPSPMKVKAQKNCVF